MPFRLCPDEMHKEDLVPSASPLLFMEPSQPLGQDMALL